MPRYRRGPKLTVDAVWVDRGRLLVVRRGRPPFRGWWALPGGFVEPDESVEHAVVREVFEETGLKGRPGRIVGVYSEPGRDPRGPTATVAFELRGRAATPRGGDDAADARWLPIREAVPLAFDHGRIVRDAVRAMRETSRRGRDRARRR